MLKPILAAALLIGTPLSAFAQTNTAHGSTAGTTTAARPGPSANQNNPQAAANQAGQPANAQTSPGSDSASSIPTPTLSSKMTAVPASPSPNGKR